MNLSRRLFAGMLVAGITASFACSQMDAAEAKSMLVFVGTYTGKSSKGIYTYRLNTKSGELTRVAETADVSNPSFVAIHPNGKLLFAVNEVGNFRGEKAGAISAFKILDGGKLEFINQQSSRGGAPCHLVVDKTGKFVLAANYTGGSVIVLPINDDGSLGKDTSFIQHVGSSVTPRQKGPHAHSINLTSDNRFAVAADLGLYKVLIYEFNDANGTLKVNDPAFAKVSPGGGPRHFAFHPSEKFGYTNNEITSSVTAFRFDDKNGDLTSIQTISTLPKEFDGGNSTAEIRVTPDGKFLYCSNRGHNSLAMFKIDQGSGKLEPLGNQSTLGKTPRNFNIDPTGKFVLAANQQSDSIAVFRIKKDGRLKQVGESVQAPTPVCIRFLPE